MAAPPAKAPATATNPGVYDNYESSYTQQPPPYVDASSSASASHQDDGHSPLLGEQRDSMDNTPDDFKYGTCVAEGSIEIRHQFVRKVYSILFVQLLATGVVSTVSFYSTGFRNFIQTNPWMLWLSLFASIGFMLLTYWKRKSYPTNLLFLGGFTAFEAYTVAVITSFYNSKIVLEALVLTAIVFAALTLFAMQTKYDFTSWAPWLFGGLWLLIGFGFVAAFFPHSSGLELAYSCGACLLFSGYILVDTQMIMRKFHYEEEIAAAISLYLDIINLFLAILRILNNQNNN